MSNVMGVVFEMLPLSSPHVTGVVFDVKRLTVGDFLWVAREKNIPRPGYCC